MKNLQISVSKALLVGALATGMLLGSASADTTTSAPGYTGFSEPIFLASTDFKGIHPNKPHVVYERQSKNHSFVQVEKKSPASLVLFSGKPPYNRHSVKQHELEKVQFARLEESTGVVKHKHSLYRGWQGKRPPYRRNW